MRCGRRPLPLGGNHANQRRQSPTHVLPNNGPATATELYACLQGNDSANTSIDSSPRLRDPAASVDGTSVYEHELPSVAPSVAGFSDDDVYVRSSSPTPTSRSVSHAAQPPAPTPTSWADPRRSSLLGHQAGTPMRRPTTAPEAGSLPVSLADASPSPVTAPPDAAGLVDDDLLEEQLHDARLLTAASVCLAACGVRHALSRLSSRPALTASVSRILHDEISHVHVLDQGSFARLCQLLTLPLEVGAAWQLRVLAMQRGVRPVAPEADAPVRAWEAQQRGECAAAAAAAFQSAVRANKHYTSAVRRFGRQTVWCTVALLRRVLREAEWSEGERTLSDEQAEAQLATIAVSLIGRNMVATVATGW